MESRRLLSRCLIMSAPRLIIQNLARNGNIQAQQRLATSATGTSLLGYSLHEKIMPCSIQLAVETFIRAKTLRPLSITTGATTYATGVFLLRCVKKSYFSRNARCAQKDPRLVLGNNPKNLPFPPPSLFEFVSASRRVVPFVSCNQAKTPLSFVTHCPSSFRHNP
jgi:hypothetical protein